MSPTGGITISGQRNMSWGVMYVAVGGLVFEDDRVGGTIQGSVYAGVDADEDGMLDCHGWADWQATKQD